MSEMFARNNQFHPLGTTAKVFLKGHLELEMDTHLAEGEPRRTTNRHTRGERAIGTGEHRYWGTKIMTKHFKI